MKYFFILLLFISTTCFAQKKTTTKAPAKKMYIPPPPPAYPNYEEAPAFPQAFMWQINTDTTLVPNSVFKEVIEMASGRVDSRSSFKDETVTLKKSNSKDYDVDDNFVSRFNRLNSYHSATAKNILTLTDEKTKAKRTFKLFYGKDKKIIRLQDLKTKKFYEPTAFEGGSPSM